MSVQKKERKKERKKDRKKERKKKLPLKPFSFSSCF
jgi:hypothetical protein